MQNHVKIYMDFYGYKKGDFIPSEISGEKGANVHHIDCRGMGGSKDKDNIENLMALTVKEHERFGDKNMYMKFLKDIHQRFMKRFGKKRN